VKKTAASATQFVKCILLHASSCTAAAPRCISTNKNFIVYLTSWHNSIFGCKQIKNN